MDVVAMAFVEKIKERRSVAVSYHQAFLSLQTFVVRHLSDGYDGWMVIEKASGNLLLASGEKMSISRRIVNF